eukprot:3678758-Rhodomonas_salina.1
MTQWKSEGGPSMAGGLSIPSESRPRESHNPVQAAARLGRSTDATIRHPQDRAGPAAATSFCHAGEVDEQARDPEDGQIAAVAAYLGRLPTP